MKIESLLLLFFLSGFQAFFAQETPVKDRLNLKLGYARNEVFGSIPTMNVKTEINYGIHTFLEIGPYLGYGGYSEVLEMEGHVFGTHPARSVFLGMNMNFHFLPFLVKKQDFRFDFYLSGKLGAVHVLPVKKYHMPGKFVTEYGIYGGMAFYLFKHVGVYAELGRGSYMDTRYGLSLKF
jgi:hypothetical protein